MKGEGHITLNSPLELFLEPPVGIQPGNLVLVFVCHKLVRVSGNRLGQRRLRSQTGFRGAHPLHQARVATRISRRLIRCEIPDTVRNLAIEIGWLYLAIGIQRSMCERCHGFPVPRCTPSPGKRVLVH